MTIISPCFASGTKSLKTFLLLILLSIEYSTVRTFPCFFTIFAFLILQNSKRCGASELFPASRSLLCCSKKYLRIASLCQISFGIFANALKKTLSKKSREISMSCFAAFSSLSNSSWVISFLSRQTCAQGKAYLKK